jgi:hypothetical protein
VVDDHDTVARQSDVELQTVGAERQALIEGHVRIFGRKSRASTMREHQRPRRLEERMNHVEQSLP